MKKLKLNLNSKRAKKEYLDQLIESPKQEAVSYEKENNYDVGDFINHFKFGFGLVQKVVSDSKIEIFFEDSEKVMLQNWKSAS